MPTVVLVWARHAHGNLGVIENDAWVRTLLARLTDAQESSHAHRWQVEDAPTDYIAQMLGAIVGIAIEVIRLQAKWKVSQNRSASDCAGVAFGLDSLAGGLAMAVLVRGNT